MPYEAAKAVASTFCYNIRHALTPVFGVDFMNSCIHPNDPNYGRMVIPGEIIDQCAKEARHYRAVAGKPFSRESSAVLNSPRTPETLRYPQWHSKSLRPKSIRTSTSEYGYGTDSDPDDRYHFISGGYHNEWTPANTPRSAAFFSSPPPRSMLNSVPTSSIPLSASSAIDSEATMDSSSSSSGSSSLTPTKRRLSEADGDYRDDDEESSDAISDAAEVSETQEVVMGIEPRQPDTTHDDKAAYMLMKLHMADATLMGKEKEEGKGKRRRAST
jgi:hypothetical protein